MSVNKFSNFNFVEVGLLWSIQSFNYTPKLIIMSCLLSLLFTNAKVNMFMFDHSGQLPSPIILIERSEFS